ncbi:MAG: hypothetical protein RPU72_12455 [Candidatus Sedimenticola sp. (ex Thyasira tokunagai)]
MKYLIAGITTTLLLATPALQSGRRATETFPAVYSSPLFETSGKAAQPVFGLQMAQAGKSAQGGISHFRSERPSMIDFQMKNREVSAFTVNGLCAMTKTPVVYANGTTGTEMNINWYCVAGGVPGVWAVCEANEWDAYHGVPAPAGGSSLGGREG